MNPYLTEKCNGVSKISLTNSTDITCLAALLTASSHSITLDDICTNTQRSEIFWIVI